jgi:hypothetical protein
MSVRSAKVLDLKPTQLAVGMLEVVSKLAIFQKMGRREQNKFIKKNAISVVIAPNRELYIVDGHHHTSAYWMMGLNRVKIDVLHDFSNSGLSYRQFWKKMLDKDWCHLYDKYGDGPRDPMYLPPDIRGLADDPYRTLAWLVRQEGGYRRTDEPFAEFQWANFFRAQNVFDCAFDLDFEAATKKALRLARTKAAKKLPGFGADAEAES